MSPAELKQDAAFALRAMQRAPGFAAIAVLTLAAGIGVNTAMFSVVNAVLVRPLPYANTERVLAVWNRWPGTAEAQLSQPEVLDFRERARSVMLAAFAAGSDTLTGRGEAQRLRFTAATANWLDVLGVRPALGRGFLPEEERPGNERVVILTDGLWRRLFGADPGAIGQRLTLDRIPFTVIGVLPPDFVAPGELGSSERSAYIRPLAIDQAAPRTERGSHFLFAVALMRDGFTPGQAAAEIAAIASAFIDEYKGEYDPAYGAAVKPLRQQIVGDVRAALLLLLAAVSLVLLIACANVANLLLARAQGRGREMAVRKAAGAAPARLVRQLLTESFVLALLSAAAGLVAAGGLISLAAGAPTGIPRIGETTLDLRVLAFTAGVSIVTALLFGMAPALQLSRGAAAAQLQGTRGVASGGRSRVRAALVSVQVALALILLVGAGLLLQSFARVLRMPSGFSPEHVLTLNVAVPVDGYEREKVVAFFEGVLDRIRSTTGVVDAGAIAGLPLLEPRGDWDIYLEGETPTSSGSGRPTDWQVVTPGYFEAMGIRLVRGRFPSAGDRADVPAIVVVNETFARSFFPSRDPVGRQVRLSGENSLWMTIVGIAGDVRQDGLDTAPQPEVYVPHAQFRPFWDDSTLRGFTVVVRAAGEPTALAGAVRRHVRELDPNVAIATIITMDDVVGQSVAERRLHLMLLGLFAAIALVLAVVGTYGVLACQISERTREFGVRLALGATARDIAATVLRDGMRPAIAGVAFGLAGAALVTRTMTNLLFETRPLDLLTFAAMAGVLLVGALCACGVPARRATRVDPGTALRAE